MAAINLIEEKLGFRLPQQHREAIANPTDPVHECCDFLLDESPFELLRLADVNDFLHSPSHPDPWPPFLLAFASNGCGDYFAYDLRTDPAHIIYVDPDDFVSDNLASHDILEFPDFETWHAYIIARKASVGA